VPRWVGHSTEQLARAARYFALVGVAIGALGALSLWLAALALPTLVV